METNFQTPQRQDFRGIFVIFFMDIAKRIKQNIYAFLPLLSSNIRDNYLHYIIIGFTILLFIQLFYSYKDYLNFKFHIQNQRFFLRHGVFKFTDIDIPFDRIQNININQNIVQQILNVVGFEIETAGQGKAEIKIKALSREDAQHLKKILLQAKVEHLENNISSLEDIHIQNNKVLFELDISRLLKVGMSSNYLKGLGIVIAFFLTLYQYIADIFSNFFEVNVEETYISQIPETISFFSLVIIVISVAVFMVTVGSSVIRYFNLKITKSSKDFDVEYGLLKRINQVIKKNKTQVFEIEQNPIKDLFKIKNVFISQASSAQITDKKKIGLVGLSDIEIKSLFQSLLGYAYPQDFIIYNSSLRLMIRLMSKYFIVCLIGAIGIFYWQGFPLAIGIFIILLLVFYILSYKTVKKSHIGINENLIEVHSGSLHTNKKYISTHKIQSLALKQNWFQQRNQHADIFIYTASGIERVNYINLQEVVKIINYLNFKVESSQLHWI